MYRIVLVDDSAPLRRRVSSMLEEIPEVEIVGEAETPGDAIRVIQQTRPDLVVLDLRLRDGVGLDVLQQLRLVGSPARVVVFTNHPVDVFREVYATAGADAFFDKARDSEHLLHMVRRLATSTG